MEEKKKVARYQLLASKENDELFYRRERKKKVEISFKALKFLVVFVGGWNHRSKPTNQTSYPTFNDLTKNEL